MKPGPRDVKINMMIEALELAELKRHTWLMGEAFGLDSRIERYQGKRSIGLYRWDMECLISVVATALDDPREYPSHDSSEYQALKRLYVRMQEEYQRTFG
ncbi:MAG: hypothetical protein DDT28_00334 [Dehalococcoidia bacterium]|nr:hypothetical protein [Chloroflexota bacterium]